MILGTAPSDGRAAIARPDFFWVIANLTLRMAFPVNCPTDYALKRAASADKQTTMELIRVS
jgi:hypothetical protein